MTQITLKTQIDQSKLNALLLFLKSFDIDAEVSETTLNPNEKEDFFAETRGMWKDRDIDAKKLRLMAMGLIEND